MRIFFAIIGLLLIALSTYLFARRIRVQLFGAIAEGTIIRLEKRESDDSISYFPVVAYVDNAGEERTFTSTSGVSPTTTQVGARVPIRYLLSSPSPVYIASFRHMWGGPVAFLFLGIMAIWAAKGFL